ncbi:OPT superfamily oligopeptide transporter [Aspergillus sclerotiicarbonarius CBS 121057]|uniref:OPT superfamily oligopeptide transporter n=1 Tax=Aspergillus sclerotiicarbonarius (strain CBS 121057 / IBT 28362) TaxID=1448318 RepID=A0A319EET9_ASPSB|nr:OPT superfamily oligopeptide transporter [Aspergillus sclerotiicarbonarius CBS 121057]
MNESLVWEDDARILRIRSMFVGVILGAVVNAANVYLGLKTGITFPANLFSSIIGFAIVKNIGRAVPANFPILGGSFGPKENNILMTSATAAGGLSNVFISAIPALYQMNLLHNPMKDYGRIITVTLGMAYVGFFFATPLRAAMVVKLARKLRLVFPSATATATTIVSVHVASNGEQGAMKKIKALLTVFVSSLVLRVASNFATGILWDWHVFTWIFIWGNYSNSAIFIENWAWYIEWSPAIMGAGMLVGLNTAVSMFAGSVFSWGIAGPLLVKYGAASGTPLLGDNATGPWKDSMTYFNMALEDPVNHPSPRYWLFWPGVLLIITASFAELFSQVRVFQQAFIAAFQALAKCLCVVLNLFAVRVAWLEQVQDNEAEPTEDIPDRYQIKPWMWLSGLLVSIIVTCVSCAVQWDMSVSMAILSLVLAGLFSFISVLSTGMTDMTPLTASAKASQFIFGGITRGGDYTLTQAEMLNSIGGAIANGVANQATDLTADFRTGFLLRTPPRTQWFAQGIASMVAIFLAPAIFIVFTTAYPCILDLEATSCSFSAPSVSAWRAATIAATSPTLPIPPSSGYFAIGLSVLGCATVIFKNFFLTGDRERYIPYVPNFVAFALMMVVPSPSIGLALLIGATISFLWGKSKPENHGNYSFPVAAGMIAGEGIGGVINAIIAIAGVTAGTQIGCPMNSC